MESETTKEEILKYIEEKMRVQIISAKPSDLIIIEVEYGLISPDDANRLDDFFYSRGFKNVTIVYIVPGRGNLKYTVIDREPPDEAA